jgi:CubicO group peptidase (beta-lactamase class C family)
LLKGTKKSELEVPLLHDPGAGWTYGASTRVLGLIVEKLSGKSLEAFFQERIFGPLGMMDTSYAVVASKQGRVATLHRRVDGALQEEPRKTISGTPHPPFRGDGGLYSTAHDYTQLLRMLLNGGRLGPVRLLSERSVEAMGRNQIGALFVTEQPEVDPASSRAFPLGAGRDKFGLGFQITGETEGRSQYRSAGSMSWSGAFNTEFWIDPRVGIGAVLMMQTLPFYDPGAIRTLQEFEAAVYRIPWLSARVR